MSFDELKQTSEAISPLALTSNQNLEGLLSMDRGPSGNIPTHP